jgi:hypothetical protein
MPDLLFPNSGFLIRLLQKENQKFGWYETKKNKNRKNSDQWQKRKRREKAPMPFPDAHVLTGWFKPPCKPASP